MYLYTDVWLLYFIKYFLGRKSIPGAFFVWPVLQPFIIVHIDLLVSNLFFNPTALLGQINHFKKVESEV